MSIMPARAGMNPVRASLTLRTAHIVNLADNSDTAGRDVTSRIERLAR
jgi:hypothetical protein